MSQNKKGGRMQKEKLKYFRIGMLGWTIPNGWRFSVNENFFCAVDLKNKSINEDIIESTFKDIVSKEYRFIDMKKTCLLVEIFDNNTIEKCGLEREIDFFKKQKGFIIRSKNGLYNYITKQLDRIFFPLKKKH